MPRLPVLFASIVLAFSLASADAVADLGSDADPWRALSAVRADVDRDGVDELIVGEVDGVGGVRLRVAEAQLAAGSLPTSCFAAASAVAAPSPGVLALTAPPDLLAAGDLDADGHDDLIWGELGARVLHWRSSPLAPGQPRRLQLPAPLRWLAVADIDRLDGLPELLVATAGADGRDHLWIYGSAGGALPAAGISGGDVVPADGLPADGMPADMVALPSPIRAVAALRPRGPVSRPIADVQVEAGGDLWRVEGRWARHRVVEEGIARQVHLVAPPAADGVAPAVPSQPVSVRDGRVEIETRGVASTFRVDSLLDLSDFDTADGVCNALPAGDPGSACTLRAAVEQANASPEADVVIFNLPGPGPHELAVGGPAAIAITEPLWIDGTSQQGWNGAPVVELAFDGGGIVPGLDIVADDVLVCGLSVTGFPAEGVAVRGDRALLEGNWIGIDPSGASAGNLRGIAVSGDRARIGSTALDARNVISANTTGGIVLGADASEAEVVANRIGTDPAGLTARPNGGPGVRVDGPMNVIGGPGARDGNRIAGNVGIGVFVTGDGTRVQGNDIGIDVTDGPMGNEFAGIFVDDGADAPLLGGASNAGGNVIQAQVSTIGGAGGAGIVLRGSADAAVRGNLIGGPGALGNELHGLWVEKVSMIVPTRGEIGGTTFDLSNTVLGNGRGGFGHGILIEGGTEFFVGGNAIGVGPLGLAIVPNADDGVRLVETSESLVGGAAPGGRANLIAFNGGSGIGVHDLDASAGAQNTLGNTLSRNTLFGNGGLGIDLTLGGPIADGPTANDPGDGDFGPNRLQNFPLLETPTRAGGVTTIDGTVSTAPAIDVRIEVFDSPACDPSGFGEASSFLGDLVVTTDGAGDASFSFQTSSLVVFPTATATRLDTGDTSELSPCPAAAPPGVGILGDRVWQDLDADGLQAIGEPGVVGLTVRLLDGASLTELATTVTDADGAYRFVGLATGSYRIAVDLPAGLSFTAVDAGGDDSVDSDVDPSTGTTEAFSYTAGTIDVGRDAGVDPTIFKDGFESGDLTRWDASASAAGPVAAAIEVGRPAAH
ncbi:MAG: SdrD B-like domain-containing protein [Acidobacteriota bacterium]